MKQTQLFKPTCSDVFIMACDGFAYAVGDKQIRRAEFSEVIPFIRDEMVDVFTAREPSLIEIVDKANNVVHPYSVKGQHVMLSPNFFNQGYRVLVNKKHCVDLTLDFWCEYVGDLDELLN